MSKWNYRIVRYRDGSGFGLHEVHYNGDGKPWAMTEQPCDFACDIDEGAAGIIKSLEMALRDARSSVLDEPETWAARAPEDCHE